MIDLLYLLLAIVIGRGKKDCQGVIEQLAHLELTVELVPPYILGTLGNTNHKLFGLVFTGCKQKRHQAHKKRRGI